MKPRKNPGHRLAFLAVLIIAAAIAVTGCLESGSGRMASVHGTQAENPAAAQNVTAGATTGPAPGTVQPPGVTVPSAMVIQFDPVRGKKIGDPLVITGTTRLPEGTDLFWQIRPDTGMPPTGIDMNSRMGIMENNRVTKGRGAVNQVSLTVDTNKLVAGKYVAIAMTMKEDPGSGHLVIGDPAGYVNLTLN